MTKPILRIAVTGGAGQIAYQLLFRIAHGDLFGRDQPLALHILEIPEAMPAVEGVKMELQDCAFPLLHEIQTFSDPLKGFEKIDYAILIGAKPRGPGMERGDLLQENAKIFVEQGKALNDVANRKVKVFVVGNPCNTNCLIAMNHAPDIKRNQFYAMTRLDQNRATSLLAQKSRRLVEDVSHVIVWGNHSATQVPDFFHARIEERPVVEVIKDKSWLENDFFEIIQKRGAAIIKARGKSSAASAAHAILDMIRDTLTPTSNGHWFSSAIDSTGNPYGIEEGIVFSFPCTRLPSGEVKIISGLDINPFLEVKLRATEKELLEERDLVSNSITKQ